MVCDLQVAIDAARLLKFRMFAEGVKKFPLNVMYETYILHLNKCGRNKGQDGDSYGAKGRIETKSKNIPREYWRPGTTPQSAPPFAPQ